MSVQQLTAIIPYARDCTYNLFRNRQRPELLCAVPEDRPVPSFLEPDDWSFEWPLRPPDMRPPGFEDRAAHVGVRFNGFYLFQLTATHRQQTA